MRNDTRTGLLVLILLVGGCGSDGDGDADAGSGGSTVAGTGAVGGAAGAAGAAGTGTGGNSGTGGAAGTGANDGGMMGLTCDTSVQSVTACAGTTCPTLDTQASSACQVTCCTTSDECGQRNTSSQAMTLGFGACAVPAVEDARCPGVSFGGMGGMMAGGGVGCCLDNGNCGIAFMGSQCIDTSRFSGGMVQRCDGSDADAGTL